MDKILRWWHDSQFVDGEYHISAKDAYVFTEVVLEKGNAYQKLKTFFDERFIVKEEGVETKSLRLAIYQTLRFTIYQKNIASENSYEKIEVEDDMFSFFDWLSECVKLAASSIDFAKKKESICSFDINFKEVSVGSWEVNIEVGLQDGHDVSFVEFVFVTGTYEDGKDLSIEYIHPSAFSLSDALS